MAEQPPSQSCGNCRNYQMAAVVTHPDGSLRYRDSTMVCKLNPPRGSEGHSGRPIGMGYSVVEPFLWCAHWAPANPESFEDGAVVIARLVMLGDRTAVYGLVDKLLEIRDESGPGPEPVRTPPGCRP